MQILIFSLLILLISIYLVYKIKKSFTKKEFFSFIIFFLFLIGGIFYYNYQEENKMPNAFKTKYLKERQIQITKLSYNYSSLEVLSSNTSKYNFLYIIKKDKKDYVCEAKNVEVQKIEDEFVFKKFKEECRLK